MLKKSGGIHISWIKYIYYNITHCVLAWIIYFCYNIRLCVLWSFKFAQESGSHACTTQGAPVLLGMHFELCKQTGLIGILNFNRQNRQNRACRIENTDSGFEFSSKISDIPMSDKYRKTLCEGADPGINNSRNKILNSSTEG